MVRSVDCTLVHFLESLCWRYSSGNRMELATIPKVVARSLQMVSLMSRIVLLLLIVSTSTTALAIDPVLRMSQYAHTSWRLQDGVFNGIPTAIVQTTDGYLWIGTSSGLMRFDGVRFVPWTPPLKESALADGVYSLGASQDGSLWIGSSLLMRWKDGKLSSYPSLDGRVNAILDDPAGGVWITRSRTHDGRGPLCHIFDERVECFAIEMASRFLTQELCSETHPEIYGWVEVGAWPEASRAHSKHSFHPL